jgi:hypothetical protein
MEGHPMLMDQENHIVKMAILSKAIHMFNTVSIKIPNDILQQNTKVNLKVRWKHRRPQKSEAILPKNAIMLEVSQYLTSNDTAEHGSGTKIDMKTSGIE